MTESRWVMVNCEADIINARLYTRQMAKEAGLQIMDQARISLAVSSLAYVIRLGDYYSGQVVINRITDLDRSGIQVSWILKPDGNCDEVVKAVESSALAAMVDDVRIETSEETGICITAIKWAPRPIRQG